MGGRFSVEAAFKAIDGYSSVVAKMGKSTESMLGSIGRGVDKVNAANGKVIEGLKAIGVAAIAAGTVAGAGLLHIVHAGADFEQSITNVGAVMGKTRVQIADLEKEAMRLGVVTQFSSSEVAEAMEMMAKKGFDSAEILQGIPGVLNAIAASGQGMAEVSTVVGSAIRGFGLEAKSASHVADLLAFAAEKTGATITDMGVALSNAAPTAKTLGVSIEDTAAAVGLMQKMGIDASTAGTAVATMLAKITKPSKDAAAQMAAMGIKFQDAHKNALPFVDILGQFVKAGDKAGGNMGRMAFFAELVGLRGDKAAIALSDMAKSGDFQKLANGLKTVDGYSEKVAKIRLDTTMGSWKLFTSTIEVLETKLFNLQSGPLRGVIDKTNAWVAANQDLIVQRVQGTIAQIYENMPKIVMWAERIGAGVALFFAWAAAVKVAQVAIVGFEIGLKAAQIAGAVLSGTIGLVRAIVMSETLATVASTVATGLSTAARWVWNAALAAGEIATTSFTASTITGTAATAAGTVAAWARNAAQWAVNAVVTAATAIAAGYRAVVSGELAAVVAATAASVARRIALAAQGVATGVVTAATRVYAIATGQATAATVAAEVSLAPLLVTLAAVAAAFGAVALAWDQVNKLGKDTGGLGFFGTVGEMFKQGTWDPAKAVDTYQNQQAEADAASGGGPQLVNNTAAGVSQSIERYESRSTGEVVIHDESGRAEVKKSPKGMPIRLSPSGAF